MDGLYGLEVEILNCFLPALIQVKEWTAQKYSKFRAMRRKS